MIRAKGWMAEYKTAADDGTVVLTRLPLVAWGDDESALVANRLTGELEEAAKFTGLHGKAQFTQLIPPLNSHFRLRPNGWGPVENFWALPRPVKPATPPAARKRTVHTSEKSVTK